MVNLVCPSCNSALEPKVVENAVTRTAHALPHCDECGVLWPGAFVATALSSGVLERVRTARREVVGQMAQATLPAVLPMLRFYNTNRIFMKEEETLDREMIRLEGERGKLKRLLANAEKQKVKLSTQITAAGAGTWTGGVVSEGTCARVGCDGAIVSGECVACFTRACAHCGEIATGSHQCSVAVMLSRSLVASQTRPCPRCAVPISRTEGCAQMYCTRCKTKFNWDTGKVYSATSFFDNPHFMDDRHERLNQHVNSARRCWFATLESIRNRVGSSRVARVLLCIAVRQAMHLSEFLGPATAPAWLSPFPWVEGERRNASSAHPVWTDVDLAMGDQPGVVACRGSVRKHDALTAMRKAFASKEITETVFMSRLERLERQSWQFAEATKALAGHVAGIADVVNAWLSPSNDGVYTVAANYDDQSKAADAVLIPWQDRQRNSPLLAAARVDREMLSALTVVCDRTILALAGLHSLRAQVHAMLRYNAPDDYDQRFERRHGDGCENCKGCPRHAFRPQQWLIRVKQSRDQIRDTLRDLNLATEPRGHAVTICFERVYALAFSRASPVLIGRSLRVEVPETAACRCAMCLSAVEFDMMRRAATTEADRSGIDEMISQHFAGAWKCYDDARDNSALQHIFP